MSHPSRTLHRTTHLLTALGLLALVLALPLPPAHGQIPRLGSPKADLVVVHKNDRRLELRREGRVLRSYRVALGPDPSGTKRQEGDGRTPEGVFTLDWRNANSQFYRSIHVSYPRDGDTEHASRWGVPAGGLIMVHGLPPEPERLGHPWNDWTNGCIAVTNTEMDEIWSMVDDGTTIIIYP